VKLRLQPHSHRAQRSIRHQLAAGFSLIELVIFIVIVGVGLTGILLALNQGTVASADPQVRKQALSIAQALLEEISLQAITYCDPDDANVETATSATVGAGTTNCATSAQTAATGGETRFASPQFDNVMDYNGYSMSPIVDITNTPLAGLGSYTASVTVTAAALGSIGATGDALLIRVIVTGPGGVQQALSGYRTRYAPNAAP
jgi:MSHA pilin protein MshD